MTFSDIFSESFLEGFNQDVSAMEIVIVMALGLVIGIFIYFIYRKTFQGVLYSKNFSTSLILLTMITAAAVMTIKSQIVLSLGMVGALSIVRFRAAIKSPMDIVFMFWAITAGIISGAGLYILAISTSVVLGIVTYAIYFLRNGDKPYMLVVNFNNDSIEQDVTKLIKEEKQLSAKRKVSLLKHGSLILCSNHS